MKWTMGVFLLVCLLAATGAQAQPRPFVAQQILPLLHEQMVAANAHDTDRFLATFCHDASLLFVINGEVIRGFDNLHEQQIKWWNHGKSDTTYTEQTPPDFDSLSSKMVLVTQQLASHRTMPGGQTRRRQTCRNHDLATASRWLACHLLPRITCTATRPPPAGRDECDKSLRSQLTH